MPPTVLLADGDATSLEQATVVLTREGFRVEATPDGGDALARFMEHEPAIVVCDASLPVIDGVKLCKEVKSSTSQVPVVLVVAAELKTKEREALAGEAGCDAVLTRPMRYSDLAIVLSEWDIEGDPYAQVPEPAEALDFSVPLDLVLFEPGSEPVIPLEELADPDPTPEAEADSQELVVPSLPMPVPIPLPVPGEEAAAPRLDETGEIDLVFETPVDKESLKAHLPELKREAKAPPTEDEPVVPQEIEVELQASEPVEIELDAQPVNPEDAFDTAVDSMAYGSQPLPEGVQPLPPHVPLRGDLSRMPLPRLVFELYVATYSGVLHLARQGLRRSLVFSGGVPVRVDSRQLSENLGRILVEHGRITEEQYAEAQNLCEARGMRQGEALLGIGAITETDLLDALRKQTETKLVNSFAWRDGEFVIEPSPELMSPSVSSEVNALQIIWRGVHEHYDAASLEEYLARMGRRYIVATDLCAVYFRALGVFLRDLEISSLLDGKTTFLKALEGTAKRPDMAKALYVLLVTDMIRPAVAPGEPAELPEMASPAPAATQPVGDADLAGRLAKEILRLTSGTLFEALGVGENASSQEVEASFQENAAQWSLEGVQDKETLKRMRLVHEILGNARRILGDDAQRAQYLKELHPDAVPDLTDDLEDESGGLEAIAAERAYKDGLELMESQKYSEARASFEEAVRGDISEPTYRVKLAQAFLHEYPDASPPVLHGAWALLEQALQLDPSHTEGNVTAAEVLQKLGAAEKAKKCAERALQRVPDHPQARAILQQLG